MAKAAVKQTPNVIHTMVPQAGKADVHMHTTASDGAPTPQELLDHVQQHTDLDVIAVTDHDTMDGVLECKKIYDAATAAGNPYRFELILGEEVTSTAGHILALFIEKPIPKELSPDEIIRLIHDQGGLAVAAHPLLILHYIDPDMLTANGVGIDVLMAEPFDGIEIINGAPATKNVNRRAQLLNRTLLFRAEIGGSDAHILDAIGKGYTLFPGKSSHDLRQAIEQKTTEAVSTKYRIKELLKYLKFWLKMKIREMGKRIGKRRRTRNKVVEAGK